MSQTLSFFFRDGGLSPDEQDIVSAGFAQHTSENGAPRFYKHHLSWVAKIDEKKLVAVLTADLLWDWLYIDELWVEESIREQGVGKALMTQAETYAESQHLSGIWLWTQSWQASEFYKRLGYEEFTRFADFPKGHSRFGFRKHILAKESE